MRAAAHPPVPLFVRRKREHASRNGHSHLQFSLQRNFARLDSGDLRAIVLSFGSAAGLVLAAALAFDIHLVVLTSMQLARVNDASTRQLAADLLPWSAAFTAIALAGAALALWAVRDSSGPSAQTDVEFRKRS